MEDIHWQRYTSRFKTFPLPGGYKPVDSPSFIVCIPVYAEPEIIRTLVSLSQCEPAGDVAHVFLLFNEDIRMSDHDQAMHKQSWVECQEWIDRHSFPHITFYAVFLPCVSELKWGVGWARKILLDEAARILPQDGFILCLDGDCTVASNYLNSTYHYFKTNPACQAASIYFEHPLSGLDVQEQKAIITYELHLRYLEWAKRWAGHPFAGHTVGSSMAVRRSAYLQQGGMNTRQAGEDFYFLQKFMEIDGLHLIQDTTVFPSSRISHKVPFGTGRAMSSIIMNDVEWKTSDVASFSAIKPLFSHLTWLRETLLLDEKIDLYKAFALQLKLSAAVIPYLEKIDFAASCRTIAGETATQGAFNKRFFRHFNAFWMIRYLHHMRDHHFPDIPVLRASVLLALEMKWISCEPVADMALLALYRQKDRQLS